MKLKHSANKFSCPDSRNHMTYIDRNRNTGNKQDVNFLFLIYILIALKSLGALCSLGVGLTTGADVLITL